jgi:hypothetical protein
LQKRLWLAVLVGGGSGSGKAFEGQCLLVTGPRDGQIRVSCEE